MKVFFIHLGKSHEMKLPGNIQLLFHEKIKKKIVISQLILNVRH